MNVAKAVECLRLHADGIDLFVRLTPKAAKDAVDGPEKTADGRCHLKVRVRAVPEKGAANNALEKFVAKALGIPASRVAVSSGATARLKTLRVTGDPQLLAESVSRLESGAPGSSSRARK